MAIESTPNVNAHIHTSQTSAQNPESGLGTIRSDPIRAIRDALDPIRGLDRIEISIREYGSDRIGSLRSSSRHARIARQTPSDPKPVLGSDRPDRRCSVQICILVSPCCNLYATNRPVTKQKR